MTRADAGRSRAAGRRAPAWLLAVALGLSALPGTAAAQSDALVRFEGEAVRGQAFERALSAGLVFRLVPTELGWMISVTPATGDADWSAVVTPPFRGVNARYIEGWHFRNTDNTGANAPGPKNVDAPQMVREFTFVLRETDYRATSAALDRVLWGRPEEGQRAWDEAVAAAALARGRLTIVDLALGNLAPGGQAWIERMRFTLEVFPP